MLRATLSAATVGLAVLALADPAMAQVGRFDPNLRASASPLLTDVQFRGEQLRRPGGPGPRIGRGGGAGPRFGGGARPNFGGDRRFGGDYRRGRGFGIGAGVAGLAAGALIGGAIASQAAPAYGYGYPGYGYDGGYPGGTVYAAPQPDEEDADVGVAAAPVGGDASGYCAQRFKSYDPSSGTYLGYDGMRHPCP